MSGETVNKLLTRARKRMRRHALLRAACGFATTWTALALTILLLDARAHLSPAALRITCWLLLLTMALGLLGMVLIWFRRRHSSPHIARLIEQRTGHTNNLLVNAAWFQSSPPPHASKALIDAALGRADTRAAELDPGAAVDRRATGRGAGVAALALLAALAAWMVWPQPLGDSVQRLWEPLRRSSREQGATANALAAPDAPIIPAELPPQLRAQMESFLNAQQTALDASQAAAAAALAAQLRDAQGQPLAGDLAELLTRQAEALHRLGEGESDGAGQGEARGDAAMLLRQMRQLLHRRAASIIAPLSGSSIEAAPTMPGGCFTCDRTMGSR